jgi:6-phosphogluconate dehydrogenase (decarboxylating)
MNPLEQLETCGQSPWLDYLRRSLIEKGELRHLIARNELKGVTSVPADVITAAPFTRFRTRREHTFGEKMPSTMRFGFGGHVEGQEPVDPALKTKDALPRAIETAASAAGRRRHA